VLRFWIACSLIAMSVAAAADDKPPATGPNSRTAPTKPKADIVPGYELRLVEGFTLLVNRDGLREIESVKSRYAIGPLEVLENELKALNAILLPKALKPLQTVRIFVEWDNLPPGAVRSEEERARGARVVALYRSGSPMRALQEGNIHPLKMNAVEIMSLKRLTEMHQPGNEKDQIILLHELCHAVQHVYLGFENRDVNAAYQQAMDRQLYEKAYARTSAPEYFAEISCAYLDRCNHAPHTSQELKEYDPVGYKLMELVWGKADGIQRARERIAKERAARSALKERAAAYGGPRPGGAKGDARPADAERIAAGKLDLIKLQIQEGRTAKAKERLGELIKSHPETKAAEEARKILEGLSAAGGAHVNFR
jgi:hypothetical protein